MSARVVSKSPNSGVPLLACTRRAVLETDPGVLVYIFSDPLRPRFPTQTCLILSQKHTKHHFALLLCFLACANYLPLYGDAAVARWHWRALPWYMGEDVLAFQLGRQS